MPVEHFTRQFVPLYMSTVSGQINETLRGNNARVVQMVWIPTYIDSLGKTHTAYMVVAFEKDFLGPSLCT